MADSDQQDLKDIFDSLNGNSDAYARLVEKHQSSISSMMWKFTRERTMHAELVQDVFVEAYLSLKTFKANAPFSHWLSKIATSVGYKYWKRKSRRANFIPIEEQHLPVEDLDGMEAEKAADILEKLLHRLPPRDRLVIMLRYVDEYSVEKTAELTGWTQAMVKVQAWRARKKLKQLLAQAGVEVSS